MSDVKDAVKLDVITGPGRYVRRDGRVATVEARLEGEWDYPWIGCTGTTAATWTPSGLLVTGCENDSDLIASIPGGLYDEEAARYARTYVDSRKPDQVARARIASLEAENAALQTELDSLRAIMDSEHETFLQELILTAYGNAPFGTDHAKVVADAKAMLRTMEGGAV